MGGVCYRGFFDFLVNGVCNRAPDDCQKTCERLGFNDHSHCIKDEFGSDEFETSSPHCIYDYTALVWDRVAEFFPVQQLTALCKPKPFRETGTSVYIHIRIWCSFKSISCLFFTLFLYNFLGFGWVTISLGTVTAYGSIDRGWRDIPKDNACITFIKIYINDKFMDQVEVKCNTYVYDADHQFVSGKIEKSSKIKIEVLYFVRGGEKLVLRTEGTVDDFIKNPYRYSEKLKNGILHENNSINTYVLWKDEFR